MAALLLALGASAFAEEPEKDPFDVLTDAAVSYFSPLEGTVASVQDNVITTTDIGAEKGIKAGMRLVISRKGKPFIHPITKEPLGTIETSIGKAEVIEAGPGSARLRVLDGSPQSGDVLRLSSALVRALFFQSEEVDWNLSEEYYSRLKDTGRFELFDTAPGTAAPEEIAADAKERDANIAIVLNSYGSGGDVILTQKIFWAEDGSVLSSEETRIPAELLADLRLGSELFTPRKDFVIRFEVPSSTRFVRNGDVDGDGVSELVIGTPSSITFNRPVGSLDPALGGAEITATKGRELLWVDVADIDGDKRDEIIITRTDNSLIESQVYSYKNNSFKNNSFTSVLQSNSFLRVIGGKLYGQKYIPGMGYRGPVFRVGLGSPAGAEGAEVLKLPDKVNIYDFSYIKTPEGGDAVVAFDEEGYLNLYDEKGKKIWRSRGDYGGNILRFKKDETVYTGEEYWSVKDRIYVVGKTALTIKRTPLAKQAKGIGYKNSMLVALHWLGPALQESSLVKDIPGSILDFEVNEDKLYVLSRPLWGLDPKKLLKGKNPVVNALIIYSLKGY